MKSVSLWLSLVFLTASCSYASGQQILLNGDFSSGLDHWSLVQSPGNLVVPAQPGLFDIASSGPLGAGNAFYAHIGYDSLVNIQQAAPLLGGFTYNFFADIASSTPLYNLDGGTISVFIDGNNLASHSFGAGISKIASLSGSFTPQQSGNAILSIFFSRGFLASENSPTDWIDNISLVAVPEPSCLCLGVCGGLLLVSYRRNYGC